HHTEIDTLSLHDALPILEGEAYEPIAAAVVPVGTIRDSIVEGDITVSDVFNISPLGVGANGEPGYPLVDIYLNGEDLKTVAAVEDRKSTRLNSSHVSISY